MSEIIPNHTQTLVLKLHIFVEECPKMGLQRGAPLGGKDDFTTNYTSGKPLIIGVSGPILNQIE